MAAMEGETMNERRLATAQRILDRCNGNLAEALTYAAFRHAVASIIRETWPATLTHHDARPGAR